MDDYEPFRPTDGMRWAARRRELDSLIADGLSEPEIVDELKARNIPAEEVARAIRNKNIVLTRFLAARRWSTRLGLTDEVPGLRLLGALIISVGYLVLMVATLPRMPLAPQVFVVFGLVATCVTAGRIARKDVRTVHRAVRTFRKQVSIDDVFDDVLDKIVLPEIRQYLVEHGALRYGTELSPLPAWHDSPDVESATIVTSAGQQLRRLVERSEADAIAIAGPRGVGKTTTIQAIADGMFSDADEPPPLPVVAAAPSRYDARDFVLHLHALLCRRIIGLLTAHLQLETDNRWWRIRWTVFRPWLVVAGFLALLFVTTRGLWDSSYPDFYPTLWDGLEGPLTAGGQRPAPVAAALLDVLRIALALSVFGVFVHLALLFAVIATRLIGHWLTVTDADPDLLALREEAHTQLRRTRFLQTHTSGWSGKIGLPAGSDIGGSRSLQRAEQALTHPEVVDNFRRFAQRCADELREAEVAGRLVIAIDELDKIAEPEQAHELVNDVKGVFGVPGCLFLVSVSEDAMAAFERRGIPVRDAFDSAFTHMVRLDNFTLAESRRWLSRRSLGAPEQFTYLLHCLSGGLPRELHRAVGELVDIVRDDERGDLAHVAGVLLDRELDRKAHAFTAAAQRFDSSPVLTDYLVDLGTMTDPDVDHVELAHRLMPDGPVSELHRVRWQSAGYLLFSTTMREIFVDSLDETGLTGVERLAGARANLAVNPQLAWRLVEAVRADRLQNREPVV